MYRALISGHVIIFTNTKFVVVIVEMKSVRRGLVLLQRRRLVSTTKTETMRTGSCLRSIDTQTMVVGF